MTETIIQPWSMPGPDTAPEVAAPRTSEDPWELPHGGFALVYRAPGHETLQRPVIFADGFNMGRSVPDEMWKHMEAGDGGYRMVTELWDREYDVIMLGYGERSAKIQDNAEAAIACIRKAIENRPDMKLAVGGFSMGGLVTRYALAKMERDNIPHQTEVYFSYDSPHRGAWIPISLQALAHFLKDRVPNIPAFHGFSDYVNSPAARQLLWCHTETYEIQNWSPRPARLREEFLEELAGLRPGGWAERPRRIGVANGSGSGTDQYIPIGAEMLRVTGPLHPFYGTVLYAQTPGDNRRVASLKHAYTVNPPDVTTSGIPALDNAPGGRLESFGIVRRELAKLGAVESRHEWHDFVPAVSAVAIRDLDSPDLYADIVGSLPSGDSELHEFKCASGNGEHSLVTPELGEWLLDRLPK